MKKLRVTVAGKVYDVTVEILEEEGQEAARPPRQAASSSVQEPAVPVTISSVLAGRKEVKSPLSGRVVTISVLAGQTIKEGDQLMILEAMKMNNYIYAPYGGQIAAIPVKVGDAVEEGQPLVIFS
jgi:biotin carboxyl carrier protein